MSTTHDSGQNGSGCSGDTGSTAGQNRDPDTFAAVTEASESGSQRNSERADRPAPEHPSPVEPHDQATLQPDLASAQLHLSRLDESTSLFLFQTFDDDKKRRDPSLTRTLWGTLEERAAELTRSNRQGAGVYVTVQETTGLSRKKEHVTKLRALWKEDDRGGTPALPLEPHLILETSPGKRHEYLFVEDAPLEGREWEEVQARLVADYGSDPNAKDRSRVLRLAGFYHMKQPKRPFQVRILHDSGSLPYPWALILQHLPPLEAERTAGPPPNGPGRVRQLPEARAALRHLDPDCDYQDWLTAGMALHHAAAGGEAGFELFDGWSRGDLSGGHRGDRYPGVDELAYKWASFHAPDNASGQITVRSIFQRARAAGWDGTVTATDCGIPEGLPLVDVSRLVPDKAVQESITEGTAEDRAEAIVGLLLQGVTDECLHSILLDQRNGIAVETRDQAKAAIAAAREAYQRPVQEALAFFGDARQRAKANAGFALTEESLTHLEILKQRSPDEFERIRGELRDGGTSSRAVNEALKQRRQTETRAAMATGRQPTARPKYEATRFGIALHQETDRGTVPVPLCNFHATIVREVIHDDGSEEKAFFDIEGCLCPSRRRLPRISVPVAQFPQLNWVTGHWGNRPVVNAGATIRDHLRCAIQTLSPDVPKTTIYGHIGWRPIDGAWWYLHAGGALGAAGNREEITVEVDAGAMQRYRLPADEVPAEAQQAAIRTSLALLGLAPELPALGYLCLATLYRAPTYSVCRIDQVTFIAGKTGAMKSEVSALMLAHYGDFTARDFTANWEDTVTDLEIKASHAQDAVFVIDDFKPTGGKNGVDKYHAKADRVLRGAGNQSGRGRRSVSLGAKPTYFPRCFLVSTGEDIPRGESLRGRMVILEIRKGDIDPQRLTSLQQAASRGDLAASMGGFIRWLAPQMDRLRQSLREEVQRYRQREDLQFAHTRAKDNLGSLMTGLRLALDYALAYGAIDGETHARHLAEGEQILIGLMHAQAQYIRDADEVDRFLSLLRTAFNTGRAHLSDQTTNGPPDDAPSFWGWRQIPVRGSIGAEEMHWEPQGDRIGWIKGEEVLLDGEAAFTAAQHLAHQQGQCFEVTERTLWRRMRERGLLRILKADEDKDGKKKDSHLTMQRHIAGKLQRVVVLEAAALDESRTRYPRSEHENQGGREAEMEREEF